MVIRESIQRKIRWLIIGFTFTISVIFIGLLIVYAWVVEDNIFNRMVSEEARYIEQQFIASGERVAPRIPFMKLYRDWQALPEHVQMLRQQSPERIEFPLSDGGAIHIREVQLGNTTQLLSANVSSYEISKDYLPKLLPWMLLVLMMVVICALVLARYLAAGVVKPLQRITFAVANNRDNRPLTFQQGFANNEIGYLADTISKSFNRLHAALQRESDFSRDISHELRTPVAVLKMVSGRLQAKEPLDEDTLKKVGAAVAEVEQSVGILLALSREESVQKTSYCLLQEVEHCIINHFALSQVDDARLDIDIPANYRITCNQNLLHMLLNNLINNVVQHASVVALNIILNNDRLMISNPVDACPPDDVLSPRVKAVGSLGLGQGLHLVKRICDKSGWDVSVTSDNHNFMVSITLG
ncbi:histidine kinase dimerization/phospho-acceptor domain-containing protein [Alteromonas halophila]|uniref:histidine kinase n=1 Tax=Alteromonas halophila TaxID=516698 RepID=A0A918MVW3_9ALTE|nr:histidine kinase dimerization/phospho-acceptor domain-containing protein [Alteromonas halophila]GGW76208.1 two-component sensor histidine kinase [Alteromonas halophila]